ncbi:hypothetical protein RRG08_024415 [Elysia crispata]|uniref:Integrase zinc-binding domain-containing protein n=1 Tax=Elysia crispata TaxID=231223 RepID=A0AAE1D263_9GAST|nr:hypothetical protein RRG08_024415 [Elysia crispata]
MWRLAILSYDIAVLRCTTLYCEHVAVQSGHRQSSLYELCAMWRTFHSVNYNGSPDLNDIVESLPNNEQIEASDDPYKDLIDALNDHFNPQSNVEILKYQFRHKNQTPVSKIDDFYAELRQLAAQCKFVNPEDEIKSQIISGRLSKKLREKGLTTLIDLTNLLKFARTLEMTEEYGKQLAVNHQQINKIFDKSKSRSRPATRHAPSTSKQRTISSQQCRNCGGNWPHSGAQSKCPAFNKTCHKCSKLHHFASVCKSSFSSSETKPIKFNNKSQRYAHSHQKKNVRSIQEFEQNPDEEDDYIFYVNHDASKLRHVNVRINSTAISVLADSGASTKIISQEDFSKIDPTPKLRQATCKIFSYASSKPLETVGVFDAVIQAPNGLSCKSQVNVIKQTTTPILGWPVCQNLEIPKSTQHVNHLNWTTSSSVVKQYPEVFSNKIGKLKDVEISLHIDKTSHDTKNMQFDRDTLQSLEKAKSSLSTDKSGSILIKNNQLIIPRSLQHKCIDLAHEGHLGIMKTKQLIRQKIWFPGVDAWSKIKSRTAFLVKVALRPTPKNH